MIAMLDDRRAQHGEIGIPMSQGYCAAAASAILDVDAADSLAECRKLFAGGVPKRGTVP